MIHDVVTRWNFTYDMCRCLLDNKQAFAVFCSDELKGVTGRLKQSQPQKIYHYFFLIYARWTEQQQQKQKVKWMFIFCISVDF